MVLNLKVFRIALVSILLLGCDNLRNSEKDVAVNKQEIPVQRNLDFIWSKYHFTNTEVQQFPDLIEQSLVDYIAQFPACTEAELNASLKLLLEKVGGNTLFFDFLKEKFNFYLYHPNSPMRNDLYYEQVLKAYDQSNKLNEGDKVRGAMLLELIAKNKVGSKVHDFEFIIKSGEKKTISDYAAKFKLLVFYDPTCSHCKEVISEMKGSAWLNNSIDSGEIVVLAIDPLGDFKLWQRYQSEIPKSWVNGFDASNLIISESLYNILAYPTIYLLSDKDVVVLKDVYFNDIENLIRDSFFTKI